MSSYGVTPWLRYNYAKFDFSAVKEPGLYAIEYAGRRTDLFPIAKDVYSRTWQSSLDGFLAVDAEDAMLPRIQLRGELADSELHVFRV